MTGAFAIIRNGCLVDASRGRAEPADILLNGDAIVPIEPRGDEPPYGELARPLDQRRIIPTIQMPELRVVSSTSSGSRSRTTIIHLVWRPDWNARAIVRARCGRNQAPRLDHNLQVA